VAFARGGQPASSDEWVWSVLAFGFSGKAAVRLPRERLGLAGGKAEIGKRIEQLPRRRVQSMSSSTGARSTSSSTIATQDNHKMVR
jgi:hypothetical protein